MTVLVGVVAAAAVVAVGIVAGCYVDGALVLAPAQRRLSGRTYVEVEQTVTALGSHRYRVLLAAAVLTQIALLAADHHPASPRFLLTLASLVLLLGTTALITVRQVVPINLTVHGWDVRDPPPGWDRVRDTWRRLHRRRTALVVLAFFAQVAAALLYRW